MTGDGTNDAPALAQADVGVAMNTGTSAAKEAGNMVDLDSDPTKLIEIVEIGKQLLITRGCADDVLDRQRHRQVLRDHPGHVRRRSTRAWTRSTSCGCTRPESAILSAVIFNALVIVGADPAGPARRALHARPRPPRCCAATCWIYGLGGIIAPFIGIKLIDLAHPVHPRDLIIDAHCPRWLAQHLAALRALLVFTVLLGLAYPLAMVGVGQRPGPAATRPTARWSPWPARPSAAA